MEVIGGNLTKIFNYALAIAALATLAFFTLIVGYLAFFKPDMELIINKVFGVW